MKKEVLSKSDPQFDLLEAFRFAFLLIIATCLGHCVLICFLDHCVTEWPHQKTNNLLQRKQSRRSAVQLLHAQLISTFRYTDNTIPLLLKSNKINLKITCIRIISNHFVMLVVLMLRGCLITTTCRCMYRNSLRHSKFVNKIIKITCF